MIQDLASNINRNNPSEPNEIVQSDLINGQLKDEFRSLLNALSKEYDHENELSIDEEKKIKNPFFSYFQHLEDSLKNEYFFLNSESEEEANLSIKNKIDQENNYITTNKSEEQTNDKAALNIELQSREVPSDGSEIFKTDVSELEEGKQIYSDKDHDHKTFSSGKRTEIVKIEKVVNQFVNNEKKSIDVKTVDFSVTPEINRYEIDESLDKNDTDSEYESNHSLKINPPKSIDNIEIYNKSIFKNARLNPQVIENGQRVVTSKNNQSKQLFVNAIGKQKTPSPNISENLNIEIFKKPLIIPKGDIVSNNTIQFDKHSTSQSNIIFQDVSEVKSSELVQFILANKSEIIPLKEAKPPKYALSMSEQGEARLKLLKESERIDVLSSRDTRIGEYTSHTLDKNIQFFNSTFSLNNEQEAMLKELMLESFRGENQNAKEQNLLGYLRLSELPIINASARRVLTSNFAKIFQQDTSASLKHNNEKWQKHSFRLEDGNNINMSSKNIDGILHIKLAASNPELNRLLISMEQEIREHLKEELSLELDLQFENKEQEAFSDALGNNSDKGNKNWYKKESELIDDNSNQRTVNSLEPSVRNFGYNQMEWTA